MSGVVNRAVAEKAMAVRADELIRKPFQPQDLIARVKNLLNPKIAGAAHSDNSAGESADARALPRKHCPGYFLQALRRRLLLRASLLHAWSALR